MSSRVEENAKIIAEYYKGLDTIPYEDIVDMLIDEENCYQIHFYDGYDALNDIHYNCVSILKNNNTSEKNEYLSTDQDTSDMYTNMIAALRKKGVEPFFQVVDNSWNIELVCTVGDNILLFPQKVFNQLMSISSEHYDKDSHDIVCIIGNRELCFPSSLKSNGIARTKNNTIK